MTIVGSHEVVGFVGQNLTIKNKGDLVQVADNDVAHLMYYMSCVCNCLRGLDIPNSLRDYQHYFRLTSDEVWRLVLMAQFLDADFLVAIGAFVVNNKVTAFQGCQNEFFEITDTRYGGIATRDAVVAGRTVSCVMKMVCSERWLEQHFKTPMRHLGRWDGKYVYQSRVFSKGKRCEVQ